MSRPPIEPLAANVDALLQHERQILPQSEEFRGRVLSRARSAAATSKRRLPWFSHSPSHSTLRRLGFAFALGLLTTVALARYGGFEGFGSPPAASPAARAPSPPPANVAAPPSLEVRPDSSGAAASAPPTPSSTARAMKLDRPAARGDADNSALELGLLQRARSAVTAGNFASALTTIGEHGARFPNSRFSEEREALRIRALDGAGRRQEADRAAALFRQRFPRSVLLPRQPKGDRARP